MTQMATAYEVGSQWARFYYPLTRLVRDVDVSKLYPTWRINRMWPIPGGRYLFQLVEGGPHSTDHYFLADPISGSIITSGWPEFLKVDDQHPIHRNIFLLLVDVWPHRVSIIYDFVTGQTLDQVTAPDGSMCLMFNGAPEAISTNVASMSIGDNPEPDGTGFPSATERFSASREQLVYDGRKWYRLNKTWGGQVTRATYQNDEPKRVIYPSGNRLALNGSAHVVSSIDSDGIHRLIGFDGSSVAAPSYRAQIDDQIGYEVAHYVTKTYLHPVLSAALIRYITRAMPPLIW